MSKKLTQTPFLILGFALILSSSLTTIGSAQDGPTFVIATTGKPNIAVFVTEGESYALGCMEVRSLWGKAPTNSVSVEEFSKTVEKFPVAAEIHCDGRIKAYGPSGQPGALVIKHTNNEMYRHYIDSPEWVRAVKAGSLIPITPEKLQEIAPHRGPDFKLKKEVAPPPPPPPTPPPPHQTTTWGQPCGVVTYNPATQCCCCPQLEPASKCYAATRPPNWSCHTVC